MDIERLPEIADVVQNFLAVNGQLTTHFYKQFWEAFKDSPDTMTLYLVILMAKLVGLITGEEKFTPLPDLAARIARNDPNAISATDLPRITGPDTDANVAALKQSIMLTFSFVAYNIPFNDHSPAFKSAFSYWKEYHNIQKLANNNAKDFSDEIIRALNPAYLEDKDFFNFMIEQASLIDVPVNLDSETSDAKTLSRTFFPMLLLKALGNETSRKTIMDTMLLLIRHPGFTDDRMHCLLLLLKKFAIFAPQINSVTIFQSLSLVKSCYLWPRPFGEFAREALEVLTIEARSPGASLRTLYVNEVPGLRRGVKLHGRERSVYLIADLMSSESCSIAESLRSHAADESTNHQIQVDILANIFKRVLNIDGDSLGIEYVPPHAIHDLCTAAMEVMDRSIPLPEKEAREHRIKGLSTIRDQLINSMEITPYVSKTRPLISPPLAFNVEYVRCTNAKPRKGDEQVDVLKFPLRKSCASKLVSILAPYQHLPRPENGQHIVKFGIIGTDASIHHVVGSYVHIRREQPDLFKNVDTRFYLLPVANSAQNSISTFLCRYDRWFYRHVWLMLKAQSIMLPGVSGLVAPSPSLTSPPDATAPPARVRTRSFRSSFFNFSNTAASTSAPSLLSSPDNSRDKTETAHLKPTDAIFEAVKTIQIQKQMVNGFLNHRRMSMSEGSAPLNASDSPSQVSEAPRSSPTVLRNQFGMPMPMPMSNGLKKSPNAGARANPPPRKDVAERSDPATSPARIMRTEVEMFFREATQRLPIKLFQCECWSISGDDVTYFTIPFCSRVEVGLSAYTRSFQEQNELPRTLSTQELQQHKMFRFAPPAVSMKFVQMNPLGAPRPGQSTDIRSYTSIVIANMGLPGDRCTPNPTRNWLEMTAIECDPKRKKKDEAHSYHVSFVDIETDDRRRQLDVLLDGELYGPLHKIKISGCTTHEGEAIEFSVMTFLPLDLP